MSSFRRGARKPYARPTRGDVDGQWLHDKAPTGPRTAVAARSKIPEAPVASVNSKLLVSNLHYDITPKDLTSIFGQIGTLVRDPIIRYDRSGRSTGTAIIAFETPTEATRAKKQFHGILAKGQPMSITYDTTPPPKTRRSASAPGSLIHRVEKLPLLERLAASRDDSNIKNGSTQLGGVGPIRSRPLRGRAPRALRAPKKPKTAEELDKELDAFMGDSEPVDQSSAEQTQSATTQAQDIDMA